MIKTNKLSELLDANNPPFLTLARRKGTLPVRELRQTGDALLAAIPEAKRNTALGLLLLWHDHGEEAHAVAQEREGRPDFDLLHALFHRREGDYSNSIYWLDGAGKHPVFDLLGSRVKPVLAGEDSLRRKIIPGGTWNPGGFVAAVKSQPDHPVLRIVQAEEFLCFYAWLTD